MARRDLPGLFGATIDLLEDAQTRTTRRETPQTTRIKVPGGTHVIRLHRGSLAFSTEEMRLQLSYATALEELSGVPTGFAQTASADVLTRAVAARCAHRVPTRASELEAVIRLVVEQATKTYEGARVAVNVCVDLNANGEGQGLADFFEQPWAAVLGSGLSTALMVSGSGAVMRLDDLGFDADDAQLAPERFGPIARWTEEPGRVALAATRTGEIYVFVDSRVLFAHRNSQWRGFPLDALIGTGWYANPGGSPRETKQAALISLLDASAAHHGACLGIVRSGKVNSAVNALVAMGERWSTAGNRRRAVLEHASFLQLSRRQRLEMLSMDGATLLSQSGAILAAGAILEVSAGSTGGGRTAAARAIGKYGVGVKVSQDGPVTAFAGNNLEPRFTMG
ncbi:MAG: hypothetical protein M3Q30_01735 [Actinomycetota bacterium]|nr:hypothetical protein [Actinomycetota bacterium]